MYTTLEDILKQIPEAELIQLTVDEPDEDSEVDEDVVDAVIARVDGEIDSYVGVKYSVPLATVPAVINQHAIAMDLHYLYSRRPTIKENETIRANFDDAIKWLDKLAKGQVTLGIDPPPPAPSVSAGRFNSNPRKFSDDSMKGM